MTMASSDGLTSRPLPRPKGAELRAPFDRRKIAITIPDRPDEPKPWYMSYVEAELNRLIELPERWDGHRGRLITYDAVKAAAQVAWLIMAERSAPPQLFPLWDGGVQIEWHVAHNQLEVEVDPTGEAHVIATDDEGHDLFEGVVELTPEALEPVRAFLANASEVVYAER